MHYDSHHSAVWHPSYPQGLDAYVQILLKHARAAAGGKCESRDTYVWWPCINATHNADPFGGNSFWLNPEQQENHLYLTDGRSLYVANVTAVTDVDPANAQETRSATYSWFKIIDIRTLVHDDTIAIRDEMQKLGVDVAELTQTFPSHTARLCA